MTLIEVARQYLGETEKPRNSGFNDAEFERKMIGVGFHSGDSWCSYFVELCLKEAFPERFKEWDKLCSANANRTLQNFLNAGFKADKTPVVGSIVVWRSYKGGQPVNIGAPGLPLYTGHTGIVTQSSGIDFKSIEGNTSTPGVREGYIVNENAHRVNDNVVNGLKVMAFIMI